MLKGIRRVLAPVAAILIAVMMAGTVMAADAQEIPIQPIYVECVNPLYEQQILGEYSSQPGVDYAGETKFYTTLEEAGADVRACMEAREASIVIGIRTSQSPNEVPFHELIFKEAVEHTGVPTQGDYIERHYKRYNCSLSGTHNPFTGIYTLELTFAFEYYTTAAQEQVLDQYVDQLLDDLDVYEADSYQKVCAIYDYLCANIVYDYAGLNQPDNYMPYTAYAAMVNNTAVCQGYSNLFYRLALELGVDCRIISGIGNGGPHAWNIVQLDGVYYNLDATWDASRKQTNWPYEYFLKCDSRFYDHYRDLEFLTVSFYNKYPMGERDYVYKPTTWTPGEFDGTEGITDSDAVYLLRHSLFNDTYPVDASCDKDLNNDGVFSDADAVYLLRFTLFPWAFPLYPGR